MMMMMMMKRMSKDRCNLTGSSQEVYPAGE